MSFLSLLFLCLVCQISARVLWCGDFNGKWQSQWGTVKGISPTEPISYVTEAPYGTVMQVTYKKGQLGGETGATFTAAPISGTGNRKLCLGYKLKFQQGFNFNLGGKLPGLSGYAPNSPQACTGGKYESTCFSTRFVWRTSGEGTVYAYIPPSKVRCTDPNVQCNSEYGQDLGRGVWNFVPGKWHSIYQEVTLNTNNNADGTIKVWFDNTNYQSPTYTYDRATIIQNSKVNITNILFSSFFGGSTTEWASPKTQATQFTQFVLADSCADIFGASIKFDNTVGHCQVTPKAIDSDQYALEDLQQLEQNQEATQNQDAIQNQEVEQSPKQTNNASVGLIVGVSVVAVAMIVLAFIVTRSPPSDILEEGIL